MILFDLSEPGTLSMQNNRRVPRTITREVRTRLSTRTCRMENRLFNVLETFNEKESSATDCSPTSISVRATERNSINAAIQKRSFQNVTRADYTNCRQYWTHHELHRAQSGAINLKNFDKSAIIVYYLTWLTNFGNWKFRDSL